MSSLRRKDGFRKLGKASQAPRRYRVGRVKVAPNMAVCPSEANAQTCRCHLHCKHKSEQDSRSSPPCHAVFKNLIPSLMALLAVKYQGKTENPFQTHPANTWAFFIAICVYCLALGLGKEMQINSATHSRILGYVIITSGALSVVSLVSILLPHLLGRLIFVVWAFLPVILARDLFKHVYFCIRQKITNAIKWVHDRFNNSARRNLKEEPSLPTTLSSAI